VELVLEGDEGVVSFLGELDVPQYDPRAEGPYLRRLLPSASLQSSPTFLVAHSTHLLLDPQHLHLTPLRRSQRPFR
jgi:hypothetical protein